MAYQLHPHKRCTLQLLCVLLQHNKGYTHTFFSLETGGQATIRNFRALEDDGLRAASVFKRNKNQWKSIYDEVKEWVWQNWPKWVEEKPAWFDDKMRSMIPRDMIPSSDDQKQIAAEIGKKSTKANAPVNMSGEQEPTMISRVKSQVSSVLGGGKANKKAYKVAPEGKGGMGEEDAGKLMEIARTFSVN